MRAVLAGCACLVLAGCITVTERNVFRPMGDVREARGTAGLLGDVGGEGANTAPITHSHLDTPAGRLALTTFAPDSMDMTYSNRPEYRITGLEGDARPLILYCGGTAFDRVRHGLGIMMILGVMGDAVVWDYPGYGDSEGEPDVASVRAAATAMAAYVDAVAGDRRLVLWGHSLGGPVCADIAAQSEEVDLLVLEATFADPAAAAKAVVRRFIPFPVRVRVREAVAALDPVAPIRDRDLPVLVLGAGSDRVVPVELQRDLAERLGANGTVDEASGRPLRAYQEFGPADHEGLLGHPEVFRAAFDMFGRLGWPSVEVPIGGGTTDQSAQP